MATKKNTPTTKPGASRPRRVLGLGFAVLVEEWAQAHGKTAVETGRNVVRPPLSRAKRRPASTHRLVACCFVLRRPTRSRSGNTDRSGIAERGMKRFCHRGSMQVPVFS